MAEQTLEDRFSKFGADPIEDRFSKFAAPPLEDRFSKFKPLISPEHEQQIFNRRFEAASRPRIKPTEPSFTKALAIPEGHAEALQTPVSKQIVGTTASELAERWLPYKPGEGRVYGAARRAAKMTAGVADWMQSPEGLAVAAAEALTAGAATPVVSTLLGVQFGVEGTQEAIRGLDDIRDNGMNRENVEQFLTGLTMAEGGLTLRAATKKVAAKQQPTWFDSFVEEARKHSEEATTPEAPKPTTKPVAPPVVEPLPETAPTVEATPEGEPATPSEPVRMYHGGAAPDGGPRWLSPDLEYARGYAKKSGGDVYYVDIPADSEHLQKSFDDTGTDQVAPYVAFEAPEAITRQFKPLEAPKRESTLATLKEDYDGLVSHPARGSVVNVLSAEEKAQQSVASRLETAAEEAPDPIVADYLDKLEEAAKLHHPDALPAVDAAYEALQEGDRKKFARMAEVARQQMSSEYQKRSAEEAYRRATGEEPPKSEPAPESAPTATPPSTPEETPRLKRTPAEHKIIQEGAAVEMQKWAESVRDLQDQLKSGESAQTMESNVEGKAIEEAQTKKAASIKSLGAKEGSPLAEFKESPGELAHIIEAAADPKKADLTPKQWKLFREIYEAFDQAYEDAHHENIREYLTRADEQNTRELLGPDAESLLKGDEDISFDFGDSAIEKIDAFEERQKAALKKLISGGTHDVIALTAEALARMAAIGAAKLLKGTIGFYQWAKEMRADFSSLGEISATDLQKIWDAAMKRVEPLKGTTAAERKRLEGPLMDQLMETGELPPAGKLVIALERASTARRSLERAYTKERAQRAMRADEVRRKIAAGELTPEQGQALLKSKFKGEMAADKKQFDSLTLDEADVQQMFQQVAQHERFNVFDVMAANDGLMKVLNGTVPKASQIELLKSVFGKEFAQALIEHQGLLPKMKSILAEAVNLPRALMASMDMSAMLRQGVIFSFAHPIKYGLPAAREMFRQVFSPKNFKAWQEGVRQDPSYKLMQESGLYMADPLQLEGTLTGAEERFVSNLAEKIPIIGRGVKASERAYVGFLNKMRFDAFKHLSDQFISEGFDPADNIKPFQDLAKFVNSATGRGQLGSQLSRISEGLSMTFFSPKLIAARFNMLNPVWYAKLEPRVRMEAIKNMGRFVGAGLTIVGLMKLSGAAQVETDPRSTDFGKIRVGNTRWDIWGGFQQWVRAFAQITSGYRKNAKGDIYKLSATEFPFETRWDVGERFLATKLAPVPQLAYELMHGQKMFGGDITLTKEAAENAVPLYLQDMKDAVASMGPSAILTTGVPGFFGVGVQTYVERPPSSAIHSTIAEYISEPVTDALMKAQVSVGRVERLEKTEPSNILRLRSELTGKLIDRRLTEVVKRPNFDKMPDTPRKALVRAAIREARDQALSLSRRKFKTESARADFLKSQIAKMK